MISLSRTETIPSLVSAVGSGYPAPMRILHLLFTKGYGGLERYAQAQIERLGRRGHELSLWRQAGSPLDQAAASIEGRSLTPVKYVDVRVMAAIRFEAKRCDVVHVHSSADLGLAVPALTGLATRLIFSSYMRIPEPKKDLYHRLEYRRVDRLLVASDGMRKEATERLPLAADRIVTLPYGLDMGDFNPVNVPRGTLRRLHHIPDDAPIIGVLSRLEPLKGQWEVIQAAPEILKAFPNAWIVLAGDETPESGGTYEPKLKELARHLGVAGRVIFTGRVEETAPMLADFDLYLLPSHGETFSLGCLEAMAMGLPVIGTDAGGTPEMLADGAGELVPPKEADPLARKVIELLRAPDRRAALGEAARKKVVGVYSADAVTDRLEAIYQGD